MIQMHFKLKRHDTPFVEDKYLIKVIHVPANKQRTVCFKTVDGTCDVIEESSAGLTLRLPNGMVANYPRTQNELEQGLNYKIYGGDLITPITGQMTITSEFTIRIPALPEGKYYLDLYTTNPTGFTRFGISVAD